MPTVQELEQSLLAADKAGDTQSAQAIAADIDRMLKHQQQQAQPKPKQSQQESPSGYAQGLKDPITGAAQLLTHQLPESVVSSVNKFNNFLADKGVPLARIPEDDSLSSLIAGQKPRSGFDKLVAQQESEYQKQRAAAGKSGFDYSRLAGNIINPANLAIASRVPVATSLAGKAGLGAATGGFFGALQPVTQGDFLEEKRKQALTGTVLGEALPYATEGLSRIIKPQVNKGLELLNKSGIETTIGQKLGGGYRKAEEALKSIPFVGSIIENAERRGIESFNAASLNRSLNPIGKKLPEGLKAGNDAIDYTAKQVSQYYDDVLSNVSGTLDKGFKRDLSGLNNLTKNLAPEQKAQFDRIVQNEIIDRFTKQGKASGETIKNIESKLGQLSTGYSRSDNYDHRLLGDAVKEAQNALRQMLLRNNPKQAPNLQKANEAFANLLRPQVAGARVGAQEGVFTPNQLKSAVRELDPTRRKKGFATGNALQQDLSDAGVSILANKLPDSGTAYRALGLFNTPLGLGLSIPASALYSQTGNKLLNLALTQRPQLAAPAAKAVSDSARYLTPGVVPFGYGLLNPSQQQ